MDDDAGGFNAIAAVACGVPEGLGRLGFAEAVEGSGGDFGGARLGGGPRESPLAEGVATEVWAESGGAPGLGGVGGDEDFGDASTAIEGDSAEESGAICWDDGVGGETGEEGSNGEMRDGDGFGGRGGRGKGGIWGCWDAISGGHVEALEDFRDDGEFVEMFDPVGAVEAWDDESKGEAVEEGERLAVHFEGDDDFAVGGVIDIESLDEVWGLGEVRGVEAIGDDLFGGGLEASFG